ncbi:MAG: S-methyl-5-thioribose-1-phosphate isomerase, partial [Deltaproteobacteria bacterium]|nr:S-methyl-5-thioribose-1-phosphate isomerase [Deltaproteobacteria bacterium]
MLDQRRLPTTELWRRYGDDATVAEAIRTMVVRGAPAIGCAAAFGLAASARRYPDDAAGFQAAFDASAARLAASRPTAVNLFWALERQRDLVARVLPDGVPATRDALVAEAQAIWREDADACKTMGRLGAALIPADARILTHCNAGALATAGYGTALGVIRAAQAAGKKISVYADETRPFLQGARLTAWELHESGIDVTLICDSMAAQVMKEGRINAVMVGADRIAANGDVANKVGTYLKALAAHDNGVPFYA